MRNYHKPFLFAIIITLFILFIGAIIGFICPFLCFDSIPLGIIALTSGLALVIYWFTVISLFRQDRSCGFNTEFFNGYHLYWFFKIPLIARYKNKKYIVMLYSIMMTCIIFSFSVLTTACIIGLKQIGEPSPQNNPLSFLHSQGAIVSFIVICITMYSFINTMIIRATYDREIESLEELLSIMKEKLNLKENSKNWNMFDKLFYYVFDHTIATGHISNHDRFLDYAKELYSFLHYYHKKIVFMGLVYSGQKNIETYKSFAKDKIEERIKSETVGKVGDEKEKTIKKIIEDEATKKFLPAHDEFVYFLNHTDVRTVNHSMVGTENNEVFKILYKPYRKENHKIIDPFFKEILHLNELPKPGDYEINDNELPEKSSIISTEELGLTRFIVTNLYVIQFIATKNNGMKNGEKNVPTGYISEDITVIERYKRAFENYRETHR
ncbi:MAG: hypothetical protein Q8K98_02075 [Bacteroidota bacterium]|nr:hypothetical protein [Bacteroidota bacterium]